MSDDETDAEKEKAFDEFIKNMDREKRIRLFMMMIGTIGMTFFVKLRPVGTQRWSSIGEIKYLSDLYIVYPV